MTEETPTGQRGGISNNGLAGRIRADAAGFPHAGRVVLQPRPLQRRSPDCPHNPNTLPDGSPRTTIGLLATKAAIQYVRDHYPTGATFLHGDGAGSAGAYYGAWALQRQGTPPAGVVGDASVVNVEAGAAAYDQGACRNGSYAPQAVPLISAWVHPDLANLDNEPDNLVARGDLTMPLVHMWNIGDPQTCGDTPLACPLRAGGTVTLGNRDGPSPAAGRRHRRRGLVRPVAQHAAVRRRPQPGGRLRQARGHGGGRPHRQRPGLAG